MIAPNETLAATERAAISPTACRGGLGIVEEKIQKRFFRRENTGDSSSIRIQTGIYL